jgi:hypothetical protein
MDFVLKIAVLDVFDPYICYSAYSIPPYIRYLHQTAALRISRFGVRVPAGAPDAFELSIGRQYPTLKPSNTEYINKYY